MVDSVTSSTDKNFSASAQWCAYGLSLRELARVCEEREYGCMQLNTCPLGRWLGDMITFSASRMVRVDEVHAAQAVAAQTTVSQKNVVDSIVPFIQNVEKKIHTSKYLGQYATKY